MFTNANDLQKYVLLNYSEITDRRIDEEHWDLECTKCKIVRGFQVIRRDVVGQATQYGDGINHTFESPFAYVFRCPVCGTFKVWIVYELGERNEAGKSKTHRYLVASLPSEGLEDIEELPEDPPALRVAYREAIRAKAANAPHAAATMFRRALQIITHDLIGVKSRTLADELRLAVGRTYNGVTISTNFSQNAYIVKEAGNQGAHPDQDPDLLDFTLQDVEDLQDIFMELVRELFVVPAAIEKTRAGFMARKKITLSSRVMALSGLRMMPPFP